MTPGVVFPANHWHNVSARTDGPERIGVVCHNLTSAGRELRIYPATSTQFDEDDQVSYSVIRWRRLIVADLTSGFDLPLYAFTPADAALIVERYAGAVLGIGREKALDPTDLVSVSKWALQLAAAHPRYMRPVPEWVVHPSPGTDTRA